MKWSIKTYLLLLIIPLFSACSGLFGSKEDDQVNDIKVQGAIDPNLSIQQVGYVPINPYFKNFSHPVDVFVGYDELIYVVDDNGLNILDQKGTLAQIIPIPGATDVTQDRRLHTYVVGRVNLPRGPGGALINLPAVYHLINTASGSYSIIDTIIHPDCDESRLSTQLDPVNDPQVEFTGIATLDNNTLYVTRKGPRNDVSSFIRPDNGMLVFDANGNNIGYSTGLNPVSSSLKSCAGISSIATLAAPPQRQQGISNSKNFIITLNDPTVDLEYRVLYITVYDDPDLGTLYSETPSLLNFDYTKAGRFLYESNRFKKPADVYIAPDNLNYTFVVDTESDSLYVFTNQGYEGVNPPATSSSRKQVLVSFGGPGADGTYSGPYSFNDPSGVCYFKRMIYVCDKKKKPICRYKLNTDLE